MNEYILSLVVPLMVYAVRRHLFLGLNFWVVLWWNDYTEPTLPTAQSPTLIWFAISN